MKTLAEINKAIDSIEKRGAKLDADIQTCAVDVLTHFAEHKDTGLVNRLYLALPQGARKTAMASWLLAYAAVIPNADKATAKEQPFRYTKDKTTNPVAAAEDMWYTHKPDKAPADVFDLQVAVKAMLKKAMAAKSVGHGGAEALDKLRDFAVAVGIPASDVPSRLPGMMPEGTEEAPL